MRFAFIEAEKAGWPVAMMCRVLEVDDVGLPRVAQAGTGSTVSFKWDVDGRLVSAATPGPTSQLTATYVYDGLGMRRRAEVSFTPPTVKAERVLAACVTRFPLTGKVRGAKQRPFSTPKEHHRDRRSSERNQNP